MRLWNGDAGNGGCLRALQAGGLRMLLIPCMTGRGSACQKATCVRAVAPVRVHSKASRDDALPDQAQQRNGRFADIQRCSMPCNAAKVPKATET